MVEALSRLKKEPSAYQELVQGDAELAQLFAKLAKEYEGWAEPARGHHEGYHAFEKVIAIM